MPLKSSWFRAVSTLLRVAAPLAEALEMASMTRFAASNASGEYVDALGDHGDVLGLELGGHGVRDALAVRAQVVEHEDLLGARAGQPVGALRAFDVVVRHDAVPALPAVGLQGALRRRGGDDRHR